MEEVKKKHRRVLLELEEIIADILDPYIVFQYSPAMMVL